jgi:hypothetical protein
MDNSGQKILCSRNRRGNYLLLYAGIVVFLTIALFFVSDRSVAQGQMNKAPVVVSRVVQMDVRQPVKMVGTVFPLRESIVAGEVDPSNRFPNANTIVFWV